MPARQLFVDAYVQQTGLPPQGAKLEKQLLWIKRFYRGSIIYPIGWNKMTESVLTSLGQDNDLDGVKRRLDSLGKQISIEWSQDNSIAKISSSNIATWGAALRKAVKNNQQLDFIAKVENDVNDLISGKLDGSDINQDRYYGVEDFDDF